MITVSSLTKRFFGKTAVETISFKIKEGEIIGLLGANGAGKTTTMRLLLGYLRPTSGTVTIGGHEPLKERIDLLSMTGYLPENNPLYPEMRVIEYLQFIAGVKNVALRDEIIDEVGIRDRTESKIEELSRGYRQRVGLAAALIGEPKILVLDEPTSGLDPLEQDKIRLLIKQRSKKRTIIFSTHILSEVEQIASRLIIMDKGKIVFDGPKPKGKGGVEKLFRKVIRL